jgi:Heterokaryon incompatibility protein (HET)
MSTKYEYKNLKSGSADFRVLDLQPGSKGDPIQCQIWTTSVASSTSYEALSYCWGDKSITKDIYIGECSFPVTTNLYAALHSLRLKDVARTMWIDAICINQSSTEEKESQIGLMRDIYQQADRVVIWLGLSKPKTRLAFILLEAWTPSGVGKWRFGTQPMTSKEVQLQNKVIDELRFVLSDPELGEGAQIFFTDVITRDWWRRVWILQEAALAKELLVKCGDHELDWDHFWGAAYDIGLTFGLLGTFMEAEGRNKRSSDLERVHGIQFLRTITSGGTQLPVSDLVVFSRMSCASVPKDMVVRYSLTR